MEEKRQKETLADKKGNRGTVILILAMIVLFVIIIVLIFNTLHTASLAAGDAFNQTLREEQEAAYQRFYQMSFDWAEEKNHVSNDVVITIGDIKEAAQLEVLYVSDKEYIAKEREGVTTWTLFSGHGVYTVDLTLSEFIVDNERQYVLVRVPCPQLGSVTIDGRDNQLFENEKKIEILGIELFNGNYSEGIDMAIADGKEAQKKMQAKLMSTQRYYESAENCARELIESIIENLNPEIPELTVEVEFVN